MKTTSGWLALTALLVGCSDLPVTPASEQPSSSGEASASRGARPVTSNRVKYSNKGHQATTGRSGSATLTVQAIQMPAGDLEVWVSSGAGDAWEQQTGPGNIERVQMKLLDSRGELIGTYNKNNLQAGGFVRFKLPVVPFGSRVQVQANVSGVDGRRVGVVTVTDVVSRLADLSVENVSAAARTGQGHPVTIGATIRESVGQMGARADCVLSVDGQEQDRSKGIWVDAGGVVSCVFTHTFHDAGEKNVRVHLDNFIPGDADASNNAASTQVTVLRPRDFVQTNSSGYVYAMKREDRRTYLSRWEWSSDPYFGNAELYGLYKAEYTGKEDVQSSIQSAVIGVELDFPVDLRIRQHSDGITILDENLRQLQLQDTRTWSDGIVKCAWNDVETPEAGIVQITICTGRQRIDGVDHPFTHLQQNRWAGEVFYTSSASFQSRTSRVYTGDEECGDGCWISNLSGGRTSGKLPLPVLGSTFEFGFWISDARQRYTSTLEVPLRTFDENRQEPRFGDGCDRYFWDRHPYGEVWMFPAGGAFGGQNCYTYSSTGFLTRGEAGSVE